MGDQAVARPLLIKTQSKHRETSMSGVRFESTILAFERAKTVHALDRAATVIGDPIIAKLEIFEEEEAVWRNNETALFGGAIMLLCSGGDRIAGRLGHLAYSYFLWLTSVPRDGRPTSFGQRSLP
jgi:hypothetical protein